MQDGHKDLIERQSEHRRLVWWFARVGRVVDRVAPLGHALDLEDGEPVLLVVVTRVVTKRAFQGHQMAVLFLQRHAVIAVAHKTFWRRRDVALEHDLGMRGHLQHAPSLADCSLHQLGAPATQQASELVLAEAVGHGCDRSQDGGRVCAQGHRNGEGLAGIGEREFAQIQSPSAMRQPTHDELALADELLAIDAQVLPQARAGHRLRPPRDHQAPSQQRPGVLGPAALDGQLAQVDL